MTTDEARALDSLGRTLGATTRSETVRRAVELARKAAVLGLRLDGGDVD